VLTGDPPYRDFLKLDYLQIISFTLITSQKKLPHYYCYHYHYYDQFKLTDFPSIMLDYVVFFLFAVLTKISMHSF
jgi:hypothetical protein